MRLMALNEQVKGVLQAAVFVSLECSDIHGCWQCMLLFWSLGWSCHRCVGMLESARMKLTLCP